MSDSESSDCESTCGRPAGDVISQREAEIARLGRDFSTYTQDANFCVYLKLVHNRDEAEQDIKEGTFLPDFVHQFFTNSERIFGYKKPVIRLFYSASRLKRYFKFEYEDKLSKENDLIEPDDVYENLKVILEDIEYTEDFSLFIKDVESREEQDFRPPGEMIREFQANYNQPKTISRAQLELLEMAGMSNGKEQHLDLDKSKTNGSTMTQNGDSGPSKSTQNGHHDTQTSTKKYEIFHANSETNNFEHFQARMQSLIMWFIESATMIDYTDPKWDFFMVFEKYNPSTDSDPNSTTISTEDRYYFCGYATVYRYYAYPDRIRPRVSQMLLLPPYRRNGLGTTLLQSIYDFYKKQPATLDITAEDPDEEFIAMRDFLDCRNCLKLDSFHPDKLKLGWSNEMAREAQEKFKLCQRQSRKIYEILKLKEIDMSDEDEYRNYRLEIKNRLNIPHQKLVLDCDKVEKRGFDLPEEMKAQRDNQKLVVAQLDENYQELMKQYQHTIDKLRLI